MWEFAQAVQVVRDEILLPPLAAPVVSEPLPVVVPIAPVAPMEPKVLSVMWEFEKRHPPTFSSNHDTIEAEHWLKQIICIFDHIGSNRSSLCRCRNILVFRESPDLVGSCVDVSCS